WRSDGTPAGTVEVAAITASIADPLAELTSFQGKVAFAARHPTAGEEPWQSDGTAAGTNVVDVEPGPSGSAPAELVAAGATLFFSADAAGSGRELWASDGTPGGTRMVANLGTGTGAYLGSKPGGIVAFGARVFFSATTIAAGPEPWISDGTAAGTVLLRDVKPGFSGSVPQE